MRRRVAFGAALATAALLVALVGAMPAVAKGPPEVVSFEDAFVNVNPCTGENHTIFASFTLRVHEFNNEDPDRHHVNVQEFIDIETSDGFSGRIVGSFVDNGAGLSGSEETTGMLASEENAVISNRETGQRIRFQFNAHFTLVDMELIVENETFRLECLGPNGA